MGYVSPDPHARHPHRGDAGTFLRRARYRAWQWWRGLRAHITPDEARDVRALLSASEFALFVRMEPADRRHCLDLVHELRRDAARRGQALPEPLVVAAMVHDTGKGRLMMWHRVAYVLLNALHAGLARRMEAQYGAPWRQALWRLRHHAALGAALLRDAGSDPRVVEIVAAHTSPAPPGEPEVAWFIEADDRV